jgi:hypothetical protein
MFLRSCCNALFLLSLFLIHFLTSIETLFSKFMVLYNILFSKRFQSERFIFNR